MRFSDRYGNRAMWAKHLDPDIALNRINIELSSAGERVISRPTFYRIRKVYPAVYPKSLKVSGSRILYDDSVLLFLYYCVKLQLRLGNLGFVLKYMLTLQAELTARKQRFTDVFPTFSAINSHFLNGFELSEPTEAEVVAC